MNRSEQQIYENRAALQNDGQNTYDCTDFECCSEEFVFAMQDTQHQFSLGLKTVLACLAIAEKEGYVPKLPEALPLFGRKVVKDSELHLAIKRNCPEVHCAADVSPQYVKIASADARYVDLNYVLYNHKRNVDEDHLLESIDFWVYRGQNPNIETVYKETISIQTDYFMNLIHLPPERAKRNEKLLAIAENLIKQ